MSVIETERRRDGDTARRCVRRLILGAFVALVCAGCSMIRKSDVGTSAKGDAQFARLADEFIAGYLAWRPATGTTLGLHEYDGKLTDASRASITAELARLKKFERELAAIPAELLSAQSLHDYRLLRTAIANELFAFEDQESFTRNPMTYAGAFDVSIYIKRNFAPLEQRVRSIIAIEKQAPKVFAEARANLDDSLPQPFVETAIEIANGSADFLGKELVDALKNLDSAALRKEFTAANQQAIAELRGFADWLKKEKLPKAHNHYALGREKFTRMLREGELIPFSPEQVLEIGLKELRREQAVFAEAARVIDPNRKPVEVFKDIQRDHPTEESLIPDVQKNLEAIRQFLVDRRIITLPSEIRARVEETPQFLRATSFASLDAPGPFETKATEAFYYVTPVEK
ncbi:MAG: DUF885 family protein, partial [Verrucomicrobia bacterium]